MAPLVLPTITSKYSEKIKRSKGKIQSSCTSRLGIDCGIGYVFKSGYRCQRDTEIRVNNVIESVQYEEKAVKTTKTTIPFVKNNNFDYRWLVSFMGDFADEAVWVIFVVAVILIVTAVSNSANLTDGLDGLAAGSSAIIGVALGILAYVSGRVDFASYLNIMYIPGSDELMVLRRLSWELPSDFYGIMPILPKCLWAIREV